MVPLPKGISVLNDAKAVSLMQDKDTAIMSNREASLSFILENLPTLLLTIASHKIQLNRVVFK